MPPKKQAKPISKNTPASTRNQNPPSNMTLRSARMENATPSEHSHSSHDNRTPSPPLKQQDTPKRTTRRGQIISNVPESLSPSCSKDSSKKGSTRKSGGKPAKKLGQITQTITVQDVYRVEHVKKAQEAKEAKQAIKKPSKKDSSKRVPAQMPQTKMEEEPVVTSGKKKSKMVIDEVDTPLNPPLSKGQQLPRNSSTHKNPSLNPSSASRQHVSSGSEEDDFGMAARLRDLTFEHFQGLHLDAEQKVVFQVMFREGSSGKKRQVDFTSRELAFLEKWLGKKFRFDFLEEYLTAQANQ